MLGDVAGKDILEFGCGGAQWSTALARNGALPVGFDLSERQLEPCPAPAVRDGVAFPLVQADAERTPFRDASFDIVFADYGAFLFADPYRAVPEAARILRPGGLLAFTHLSPIYDIAFPAEAQHAQRAAGQRLLRAVPAAGRRRDGRVQPAVRDLDPAVPRLRPGGRGPDRAPARPPAPPAPTRDAEEPGLVAPLAGRVHLAGLRKPSSPAPLPPAR